MDRMPIVCAQFISTPIAVNTHQTGRDREEYFDFSL